jgi:hypothetical protein
MAQWLLALIVGFLVMDRALLVQSPHVRSAAECVARSEGERYVHPPVQGMRQALQF